ncbi:hypothetical protein [Actinoallomurus sp. NPDC050550]|uniref:hypothetical protein n=1 Tax=Actinoallomurus sp. NPDC050550 TaxID=3154937 RepID=UPI003404AE3E
MDLHEYDFETACTQMHEHDPDTCAPAHADPPALIPPVQRWRCCHCTGGLTSDGQTCKHCEGLGFS